MPCVNLGLFDRLRGHRDEPQGAGDAEGAGQDGAASRRDRHHASLRVEHRKHQSTAKPIIRTISLLFYCNQSTSINMFLSGSFVSQIDRK